MFDAYVVPANTVVTAKGESAAVDISPARNRTFLFVLEVLQVVEQEALDLQIEASADGKTWSTRPLVAFPQKFYRGTHPMLVEMSGSPEIRFIRARWDVTRWGRGSETPMFEFALRVAEVEPGVLGSSAQR